MALWTAIFFDKGQKVVLKKQYLTSSACYLYARKTGKCTAPPTLHISHCKIQCYLSGCPSHGCLGQILRKLHPKLVNVHLWFIDHYLQPQWYSDSWGQPIGNWTCYAWIQPHDMLTDLNTMSSWNHEVAKQNSIVNIFRAIKFLTHDSQFVS